MRKVIVLLMLSVGVVSASAGYSKLEALSLIESGNNDAAVGTLGEVSRYQIKPRIWREYSSSRAWRDNRISSQVAENYLKSLEETFTRRAGRAPTDFDLYVLWNAGPAYYAKVGFSPTRVHPVVRERAQRYVNLRTVNLAQGPTVKPAAKAAPRSVPAASVQTPKPVAAPQAALAPSEPAWNIAQAIAVSTPAANANTLASMATGLPMISILPHSVASERN